MREAAVIRARSSTCGSPLCSLGLQEDTGDMEVTAELLATAAVAAATVAAHIAPRVPAVVVMRREAVEDIQVEVTTRHPAAVLESADGK